MRVSNGLAEVLPARVEPGSCVAHVSSFSGTFKRVSFAVDDGPIVAVCRDVLRQKLTVVSPHKVSVLYEDTGEVFEIPVPNRGFLNGTFSGGWRVSGLGVLVRARGEAGGVWYGVVKGGLNEIIPVTEIGPAEEILCFEENLVVTIEGREIFLHRLSESSPAGMAVMTNVIQCRSETVVKAAVGHRPDGGLVLVGVDTTGCIHSWSHSEQNDWTKCPDTEAALTVGTVLNVMSVRATRDDRKDIIALRSDGRLALLMGGFVLVETIDRVPGMVAAIQTDGDDTEGTKLILLLRKERDEPLHEELFNFNCFRPSRPPTDLILTAVDSFLPESVAADIRYHFLKYREISEQAAIELALGLQPELSSVHRIHTTERTSDDLSALDVENASDAKCWEEVERVGYLDHTGPFGSISKSPIEDVIPLRLSDAQTRSLVQALHTVYESCKLDRTFSYLESRLAAIVSRLTATWKSDIGTHFFNHYARDGWVPIPQELYRNQTLLPQQILQVPSIIAWLQALLEGRDYKEAGAFILDAPNMSKLAGLSKVKSTACIFSKITSSDGDASCILEEIVAQGWSQKDIDCLASGLSLPLLNVIWRARTHPNSSWSPMVLSLIGRKDIQMTLQHNESSSVPTLTGYDKLQSFHLLGQKQQLKVAGSKTSYADDLQDDNDGCSMKHNETVQLRFIEDRRVDEVQKLLRSTSPVRLTLAEPTAASGDVANDQQLELVRLLMRPFGSTVGRGAFALATYNATNQAERLVVPKMSTSGRIPKSQGAQISLTVENLPDRSLDWPHFHNGVAAGLRRSMNEDHDEGSEATRSWILASRDVEDPSSQTTTSQTKLDKDGCGHAGLLLALGFQGNLNCLRISDWYEYMMTRNELVAVSLMIGLGCAKLGSMDLTAQKLMCMHIRSFSETAFSQPDWTATSNVQSAALVGVGLLFQGTGQRMMVEGLMSELCRKTQAGDTDSGRECLALSAGTGLGMLCLGLGRSADGLYDLNLEDRLIRLVRGGKDAEVTSKRDRGALDGSTSEDSEAVLIHDGHFINVGLTAPGALMAFGLMYLQTNDNAAMQRIDLPKSYYDLERVRPDHLLLRVLMRSVIMWDNIRASDDWIFTCLAPVLQMQLDEQGGSSNQLYELELRSYTFDNVDIDFEALVFSKAATLAACAMALGLRYAGGCNLDAQEILMEILAAFEICLSRRQTTTYNIIQVGLDYVILALSVLMAGSGDVSTLRMIRRLAARTPNARAYGSHMANSMALGFLFLGGGCKTFGRDQKSVGALLCALFPSFPLNPLDNKYHLQALRHLYCLAVDSRLLETREADTGVLCSIPIVISQKGEAEPKSFMTPCILPWIPEVAEISTNTNRYWQFDVSQTQFGRCRTSKSNGGHLLMYVQRKSGHLSHTDDPLGIRGIFGRSLRVQDFSADPVILSYVDHVLPRGPAPDDTLANLVETCIIRSTGDFLTLYLALYYDAQSIARGNPRPLAAVNLRFAEIFLSSERLLRDGLGACILPPSFLSQLLTSVDYSLQPLNDTSNSFTASNRIILATQLQRNSR